MVILLQRYNKYLEYTRIFVNMLAVTSKRNNRKIVLLGYSK